MTRITGEQVMNKALHTFATAYEGWFRRLADQLDRDADLAAQLAEMTWQRDIAINALNVKPEVRQLRVWKDSVGGTLRWNPDHGIWQYLDKGTGRWEPLGGNGTWYVDLSRLNDLAKCRNDPWGEEP